MEKEDIERKCVRFAYSIPLCIGECVMAKVSREVIIGTITGVTPIAIIINNDTIIKLSKIAWLKKLKQEEDDRCPGLLRED